MPTYTFYLSHLALLLPYYDQMVSPYCHDPLYANAQDGSGTLGILPEVGTQPNWAAGEDRDGVLQIVFGQYNVARSVLRFQTGLMGAGVAINSGLIMLDTYYPAVPPPGGYSDALYLVEATGVSNPLVPTDFVVLNPFVTSLGSFAYNYPPDPHQRAILITLNAAGLALLSNISDSVFALKTGMDISATPPPLAIREYLLDLFSSGISTTVFDNPPSVFTAVRNSPTKATFNVTLKENTNGIVAGAVTSPTKLVLDVSGIPADMSNLEVRFAYDDGGGALYTAWQSALVDIDATAIVNTLNPLNTYTCHAQLRLNSQDPAIDIAGAVVLPPPVSFGAFSNIDLKLMSGGFI